MATETGTPPATPDTPDMPWAPGDPSLDFPTFPSRSITIRRSAAFSTKIQTAASGRELRASWQSRPKYEYQLTFEALVTDGGGRTQPQALAAFYARMRGAFGVFNFVDPLDGQTRACRFADDNLELERVTLRHWKTAGIKIIEVFQ